ASRAVRSQAEPGTEERVMSTCLVTGGAGFIGSHLVEGLLAAGHKVRVLDDQSTGVAANVPAGVELLSGDVSDAALVRRATRAVGAVFPPAPLAPVQLGVENPAESHRVCATGTLHTLDAASREGVRRVVYAASASAYGIPVKDVQSEDDPTCPLSPYAA